MATGNKCLFLFPFIYIIFVSGNFDKVKTLNHKIYKVKNLGRKWIGEGEISNYYKEYVHLFSTDITTLWHLHSYINS